MRVTYGWKPTAQGSLIVGGTIAALCASTTVWADGGPICFVGAIVAPTDDITVGGAARQALRQQWNRGKATNSPAV